MLSPILLAHQLEPHLSCFALGNFSEDSDLPNENLYEQLKDQLAKLHDKEILLSPKDNDSIFDHLRKANSGEGSKLR